VSLGEKGMKRRSKREGKEEEGNLADRKSKE
jgi:hypothetical protein